MATNDDIRWFKTQFATAIHQAVAGTPLSLDFLTAIACQETGSLWVPMRRQGLPVDRVVALCAGDTLDADKGRSAFPRTRAELEATPLGQKMFQIARQALIDMSQHVPVYAAVAQRPDKFCHGFGVFQLDLQFFRDDPAYFLNREYERFDNSLDRCVRELKGALKTLDLANKPSLTDLEAAAVGIVYNTGGFKPAKGLKQGFFDGQKFYGEALFDFLRLAKTVSVDGAAPALVPPAPGEAIVPPPSAVTATGPALRVQSLAGMARLRREPVITDPPQANVVANLPDGHPVRAVTGKRVNGFIEVETTLSGALLRGFTSAKLLVAVEDAAPLTPVVPAAAPPTSGFVAVTMPRKPGTVTRRRDLANSHSLNENGQPTRQGTTPDALRGELAAIADWLAVDNPKQSALQYSPYRRNFKRGECPPAMLERSGTRACHGS